MLTNNMSLTQWISSYLLLYSTSVMEDGLQNGSKGPCLLSLMSLCNPFSLSVEWNQQLASDKENTVQVVNCIESHFSRLPKQL